VKEIVGEDYPRIAIGTVCKTERVEFIEYCSKVARRQFPRSWIHSFGLTLRTIPRVKHLINSFDSLAWSYPSTNPTTGDEKIEKFDKNKRKACFKYYIHRLKELLGEEQVEE